MSDSPDEFANYDPTTPYKPPPPKKPARPSRANNRPVAGPSSKPLAVPKKNGHSRQADVPDDKEQIVIASSSEDELKATQEEEEEVVVVPAPPKSRTARKTTGRRTAAVNGRGKAPAAKGKAKAARSATPEDDHMEVDDQQVTSIEEDEGAAQRSTHVRSNFKGTKVNTSAQRAHQEDSYLRDLEHVQKQLETVMSDRDKLSKQLEELFQVRHTEPEQALEQCVQQYEARVQTQETLIRELTSQLANVKALAGTEKSYMLHFLTREAADEEMETVQKEMTRWKDIAKQKDAQLAAKDKRIAEMEAQEKVLRSDLNAEIERGKSLAARNPPPVTRPHVKVADDPKNTAVLSLYEDMTNLLVVGVKFEKSPYLNHDEPVFACVYTHRQKGEDQGAVPSLNFSLRHTWERPDGLEPNVVITRKDQLEDKVKYQPLMLENESPKFVDALDFFKDPFMFSHGQLPIFLKTLTGKLGGDKESSEGDQLADDDEDEDDDDDDDVVEVIPVG